MKYFYIIIFILLSYTGHCQCTVSISAKYGAICQGNKDTLTAVSSGTGTVTYSWTPTTGVTWPWLEVAAVQPSVTTKYKVTASFSDGCTIQDSITIHVDPAPTVSAGSDMVTCANDPMVSTFGSASNYTNILWESTLGGTFGDPTSASTTFTPSSDEIASSYANIYLSVSGIGVCETVSDTAIIFYQNSPVPTANAGSDISACSNEANVLLSGSVTFSSSKNWSTSGTGTFANPSSLNTTYTPSSGDKLAGSVVLSLTNTYNGICGTVTATDDLALTFLSIPTADSGPDLNICSGFPVTIGTTEVVGNNYSWESIPSGFTSTVSSPTFVASASGTYIVAVTSTNGCIDKDTVSVIVKKSPVINAGSDRTICSGTSASIGSNAIAGNTYSWESIPVGYASSNAVVTVQPSSSTTYVLTVDSTNGCSIKDTVTVNTFSRNQPTVSRIGDTLIGSNTGVSWWKRNPAGVLNQVAPYCYLDSPGDYTYFTIDQNGCTDSSEVFIVNNYQVSGKVRTETGTPVANSKVYMVRENIQRDSIFLTDSTITDATGFYTFMTYRYQTYVKAYPDNINFSNISPAYFPSSVVMQYADMLDISSDLDSINIVAIEGFNPGGPGFIGGTIYDDASNFKLSYGSNKISSLSSKDRTIYLMDNSNNLVDTTVTDASGYFQFNNLAYGTYKLWLDIPSVDNDQAPEVTVSASNATQTDLEFTLHSTYLENGLTSGTSNPTIIAVSIYPNPANDFIRVDLNSNQEISYAIMNSTGSIVKEGKINSQSDINVSELNQGIYVLKVSSAEGMSLNKLVIE